MLRTRVDAGGNAKVAHEETPCHYNREDVDGTSRPSYRLSECCNSHDSKFDAIYRKEEEKENLEIRILRIQAYMLTHSLSSQNICKPAKDQLSEERANLRRRFDAEVKVG